MTMEKQKKHFQVLYAYLGENKIYQAFCAFKSSRKGYRNLLQKAGLPPRKFERNLEHYYAIFGNPNKVDFETFWQRNAKSIRSIHDYTKGIRTKVAKGLDKLWSDGKCPSKGEVLDFIEDDVLSRQMGGMLGSRNRLLLAVNIKNVKVGELVNEFEDIIRNTKLIPRPNQRHLSNLFHQLLWTTSGSSEEAEKKYQQQWGESPSTLGETFRAKHGYYSREVSMVQYHLLIGDFPGPKKLTKGQKEEFDALQKAGLL